MKDCELTLLSEGQISGNSSESQLEVLKKYGLKAAVTDLCIIFGADFDGWLNAPIQGEENNILKGRAGTYWTRTLKNDNVGIVNTIDKSGRTVIVSCNSLMNCIRPVLKLSPELFAQITSKRTKGDNGTDEVELGEYPQYAVSLELENKLVHEIANNNEALRTGKTYTFNLNNEDFLLQPRMEYKFQEKKIYLHKIITYQ